MNCRTSLSPRLLTCISAGILLSVTTIAAHATSDCSGITGCQLKICAKEQALQKARDHGDITKILALQNSLVQIKDSCALTGQSDPAKYQGEYSDLKNEYQNDLEDALNDYRDDLADAKAESKPNKIRQAKEKYNQKVQQVTDEYQRKLKLLQPAT